MICVLTDKPTLSSCLRSLSDLSLEQAVTHPVGGKCCPQTGRCGGRSRPGPPGLWLLPPGPSSRTQWAPSWGASRGCWGHWHCWSCCAFLSLESDFPGLSTGSYILSRIPVTNLLELNHGHEGVLVDGLLHGPDVKAGVKCLNIGGCDHPILEVLE